MHATVEDLKHVSCSEGQKIPQSSAAYSAVCGIASSLVAIVKSPTSRFEEKKCKLFNFIESFKTYISCNTPYRVSLTKDSNGFEYFVFIATLGVYCIDIVLYRDVHGWVMLTDGSCVRTPVADCESEMAYAVSVRKSACVPPCIETIECGNSILVYYYDASSDECKVSSYSVESAQVKIVCAKKENNYFSVYFDVCIDGHWLRYNFALECLPCGLYIEAYQDGNKIGTLSCFEPLCMNPENGEDLQLVLVNEYGDTVSQDQQSIAIES
jgi:hypothetical protein